MGKIKEYKPNKIIIWEGLSNIAGGQKVVLSIVSQLNNKYRFKVICPSKGVLSLQFKRLGVLCDFINIGDYTLGKKGIRDILRFVYFTPFVLWRAYKIVRGSDLIYVNNTRVFIWSALIGLILNTPVIWHLHNLLIDRKSRLFIELFGRLKIVTQIIAVSNAAKNQFPALAHKVDVIYNGIDIQKFNIVNKEYQKNHIFKNIGIISDVIPQKGHKTLIKAAYILKNNIPFKLLIIGKPRYNTIPYETELKNLVNELKLDDNIEFLGYRNNIPEILNELDLLVVPSLSFEACPMVILEAYACGVPVVGSDLGGTPELIEEGKTGFIFKANDELDLAKKILFILNDPKLHVKMRKRCREIAKKKYNIELFSKKIELILDEILEKSI
ncbi:MAG: GT4 family glycosyltransferase PelF [Actinobacteria bacterium]|nr:GT4 family glycosyltransferase PelF [Actinomycetota bacterium]